MKRAFLILTAALGMAALAGQADAGVVFSFTESGGTVTMTSSGTLDTSNLVSLTSFGGWGGTGIENNSNPGDIDIMGGTSFGAIDTAEVSVTGTPSGIDTLLVGASGISSSSVLFTATGGSLNPGPSG